MKERMSRGEKIVKVAAGVAATAVAGGLVALEVTREKSPDPITQSRIQRASDELDKAYKNINKEIVKAEADVEELFKQDTGETLSPQTKRRLEELNKRLSFLKQAKELMREIAAPVEK